MSILSKVLHFALHSPPCGLLNSLEFHSCVFVVHYVCSYDFMFIYIRCHGHLIEVFIESKKWKPINWFGSGK